MRISILLFKTKLSKKNNRISKIIVLLIVALILYAIPLYNGEKIDYTGELLNIDFYSQAINGDNYIANYTFNNIVIDGNITVDSSEWDCDYFNLTDANNNASAYFLYDYSFLYFAFWIDDEAESQYDNVSIWFDVNNDDALTDNADLNIQIFGNNSLFYGVWSSSQNDYVNATSLPGGFLYQHYFNAAANRTQYEMRIPMSNLSNPFHNAIGFDIGATDFDSFEFMLDKPLTPISTWDNLIFNYVPPTLSDLSVDKIGGYNDSTLFYFTVNYTSSINRPPRYIDLNISSVNNFSIFQTYAMIEANLNDLNFSDGKIYVASIMLDFFEIGEYNFSVFCYDGVNTTIIYSPLHITLIEKESDLFIFDSMHYVYNYRGFLGISYTFEDNYTHLGGGLWSISSNTNYPGAGTSLRAMTDWNRKFSLQSGSYPFDNNTSEYAFVHRNLTAGQRVNISVIGDGDVEFTVSGVNAQYLWNGERYSCYYLTSPNSEGLSRAYYEMQTGILLYGEFVVSGLLGINDYALELDPNNNILNNIFQPKISAITIIPENSDINSTTQFNITYVDWDNNTWESVEISIADGSDVFLASNMSFDASAGSSRVQGVNYTFSTILWNTSFAEQIKNYTTTITLIDGHYSVSYQYNAPNVTYINNNVPTCTNSGTIPVGPVGNETTVQFYVTYQDLDNNFPVNIKLNLPWQSILMNKNNSLDNQYSSGVVYVVTVANVPYIGTHTYNFTITDQEGNVFSDLAPNTINVFDEPPEIRIIQPYTRWRIGTEVTIELNSSASDLDTIFYNVTDLSTGLNQSFTYTLGVPQVRTFPEGDYELHAWANDTNGNLNHTSMIFTTTMDPYFDILLVDLDNSSLETYYIDALTNIGFKQSRDFNITSHFPTISELNGYEIMVLMTGNSKYNWTTNDSVLCQFVDSGGSVLISGQNYTGGNLTNFMTNYIGIVSTQILGFETNIDGIQGNPISGDYPGILSFTPTTITGDPNYTISDQFTTAITSYNSTGGVESLLQMGSDTIALMNGTGSNGGKIIYLGIEFARIGTDSDKKILMERMIYWLANSTNFTVESPTNGHYQSTSVWLNVSWNATQTANIIYSVWNNTNSSWVFQDITFIGNTLLSLSEGNFTLYVKANNSWGFYSQPTIIQFRCDITPPDITIHNPLNTTYIDYTSGIYLNITSNASDLSAIAYNFWNYSEGAYVFSIAPIIYGNVSTYAFLSDGFYRLEAVAIDQSSNPSIMATINFTVNFMPHVTINAPNVSRIADNTPYLNITAWDSDGIDTIYYHIQNTSNGNYIYGNITYDPLNPLTWQILPLSDGFYRIWAFANDTTGITSLNYTYFDFEIDTIGPSITTYSDLANEPPNENWINKDSMEILCWSFDQYLDKIWYRVYNATGGEWLTPNNITYNGSFFVVPYGGDTIENMTEGDYVVYFWANDSLGNIGSAIRFATIDISAPIYIDINIDPTIINTPINILVRGTDLTSVEQCILYYNISTSNITNIIFMTHRDQWEFNASIPGQNFNTLITYWFALSDSFGQTNTTQPATMLVNGLSSNGDYTFDFMENYNCKFILNTTNSGNLVLNFLQSNPESVEISDAYKIMAYIDISYDGTFENAELRFYYQFGVDFSKIKLLHFENGNWIEIPISENEDGNYIYAKLSSFSTYAIIQVKGTPLSDIFTNPIILILLIALCAAFVVSLLLYLRMRKKYNIEIGSTYVRDYTKKEKAEYGYQDYGGKIDTDFPEKNVYEVIKQKKRKAESEIKRTKRQKKIATAETTAIPTPIEETHKEMIEEKTPIPEIKEAEYYCESCRKLTLLPFDKNNPTKQCPVCSSEMGIKVTCKSCGATFMTPADQYMLLYEVETKCPKCGEILK
ncbi:MAG: hypothetical protein ACTSRZ_10065 [Promethearchaeota archaeon]